MKEPQAPQDPSHPPAPTGVDDPAAYVTALRALRGWSGLTFRQLERRARDRGDTLPRSTLAGVFARVSLPRTEVVAAFVRACGLDEKASAEWLRVHRQVAAGQIDPEAAGTVERQHLPGRSTRRIGRSWAVAVLSCAIVIAIAVPATLVMVTGRPSSAAKLHALTSADAHRSGLPRAGSYRLRVARSGQCLSEQRGSGSGHLYEAPCEDQFPEMALEDLGTGIYRVTINHPEFGPGCMGIPFANTAEGVDVEDGSCGKGAVEQYRWETVTTPAAGFRIHPIHNDLCLGYPAGSAVGSSALRQLRCDSSDGEIFQLL